MTITSCFALAAHAVAALALDADGSTSERIALSANTHPARVRRVLTRLVAAGIVVSREGGRGGYDLARAPEAIRLDEIFSALGEGPFFPTHPRLPDAECPVGAGILAALRTIEGDVDEAVRGALGQRSAAWLAEQVAAARAERRRATRRKGVPGRRSPR
jgi:DNA-binding IscR family transcriptional regulator